MSLPDGRAPSRPDPLADDGLVAALRVAAADLVGRRSIRDLEETLAQIVRAAVQTVPGVAAGTISMTQHGRVDSLHPTSDAVRRIDEVQHGLGEGPCLTALSDAPPNGIVIADDLAGDDAARWPRFAPRAVEAGFRSMMSLQLSAENGRRAALNLYAGEPAAFDPDARLTAGLFGVQAAMLLYGSEQAAHLDRALATRDLIGQAKGILMERFEVDDEDAFQMLVTSSQDTNVKLVDVARWLTSKDGRVRLRPDPAA